MCKHHLEIPLLSRIKWETLYAISSILKVEPRESKSYKSQDKSKDVEYHSEPLPDVRITAAGGGDEECVEQRHLTTVLTVSFTSQCDKISWAWSLCFCFLRFEYFLYDFSGELGVSS